MISYSFLKKVSLASLSNLSSSIRVKETKLAAILSRRNSWCCSNSGLGLHILQITYQKESEIKASACSKSRRLSQCSFFYFFLARILLYLGTPPMAGNFKSDSLATYMELLFAVVYIVKLNVCYLFLSFSVNSSFFFFIISLYCCFTLALTLFRPTLGGSYEYGAS